MEPIEYGATQVPGSSGKTIRPEETVQFAYKVDVNKVKLVVRDKAEGQYLKMKAALLSTEVVDFDDKTSWLAGQWLRFDDKSKKWIEMDQPPAERAINPDATFQPRLISSLLELVTRELMTRLIVKLSASVVSPTMYPFPGTL